ncbi:MAG: HD domain-containing protein [Candidatus Eisenbacteria sp.]|nr:HD domain-containing protein [Candidatus Eisenbacteria bacterium]
MKNSKNPNPHPEHALAGQGNQDKQTGRILARTQQYFAISLQNLRIDAITGFDLYIWMPRSEKHVLYRKGDLVFSEDQKARLQRSKVANLYVAAQDRNQYTRYLEGNLTEIIHNPDLPKEEGSDIVYACASRLVEEIFEDPESDENMLRAQAMVHNTVDHLLYDQENLTNMLSLMSDDYELYTHSVNVCVIGLALGQTLGLSTPELRELGTGLLMHDIGKVQIDRRILDKPEPLTDEEMQIYRTHPERGAAILKQSHRLAHSSLAVILQHHETCAGTGYPYGLEASEIHQYAKIAGLANIFDGLTTDKPARRACASFPALRNIRREMPTDIDAVFLRQLIRILAGVKRGESKSLPPWKGSAKRKLAA